MVISSKFVSLEYNKLKTMSNKGLNMIDTLLLSVTVGGALEWIPYALSIITGIMFIVINASRFYVKVRIYWKRGKALFIKEKKNCEIPPPLESNKLKP